MISKNKIKYLKSLEMKKHRQAESVFVAEGPKIVGDLLNAGFEATYLAVVECSDFASRLQSFDLNGVQIDFVTADDLRKVSSLEAPQQVLAVLKQPVWQLDSNIASKELCLALDEVQNPGNLGTIIRLAAWFGIKHLFCSKGCADVYNSKTVQATMGGLAHVKVHYVDLVEMIGDLPDGTPIYGTFLDGENLYGKQLEQRGLIVMGNEGRGVSKEVENLVTEKLFIPNYPAERESTESLNVAIATAIVCAEFRRRAL
ncbi:MAG: RNA methyltransferase [Bacteroidaceae bacterium]|nr:RNA methyltransferase [Bacteroidaceae bacterium]